MELLAPRLEVKLYTPPGAQRELGRLPQQCWVHRAIGLPADAEHPPPIPLQSETRGGKGVRKLRAGVAAKVANAGCLLIHLVGKVAGAHRRLLSCRQAVVPVLTEEAIEGAGLIEDGQVLISIFRPLPVGESGIAGPRSPGADPVGNAIGGQGVVVPADIPHPGAGPGDPAPPVCAQPAVASLARADDAFIDAKTAAFPSPIPGGLWRQGEGLPRLPVHIFNMGQKTVKT